MKYVLLVCWCLVSANQMIGQTEFGIKGGMNFTIFNENQSQFGERPQLEIGYFGGVFLNVPVSEKFNFQPELVYLGIGDFEIINAPVYLEYSVGNNLSLYVGPSLNYFFDIFSRNFKVRGDVAAAFQLTEHLEINLKYTQAFDELSPNIILVGVGLPL